MGRETHDVVIIGAGMAGLSLAYFLAKEGCDVCVIEKNSSAQESTGRCGGIIRQSHRLPPDLPVAMRAVRLWKQLLQDSDLDFEYRQHGTVRMAWTEEHVAQLKTMVELERAGGLDCTFLSRAETQALLPNVAGPFLGSVYTPSDGSAQPQLAMLSLARLAKRVGVTLHEHCEVTGIDVAGGRVIGVATARSPLASEVVVIAAGAWSQIISRAIGVRIPFEVRRSHLMATERLPRFIESVISADPYGYFRQTLSGNVLIGYGARPVEGLERRVAREAVMIAANRASIILPHLRHASLIRAFTGFTVWTPDSLPIVGRIPHIEGLYVSTAFCGVGFATGPAVGELMAELIVKGKTSISIDAYRPERFEQSPAPTPR